MVFEPAFVLLLVSAVFAGMLDATVGGGGFVIIPFLVFTGNTIQLAIGTSRLIFLLDSFSAVLGHARKRNIDYRLALCYTIPSVIGAPVGAYVTSTTSSETISKVFGFFMLAMLFLIACRPDFGLKDRKPRRLLPSFIAGLLIGFMIGLLGGGVGILIIMLMVFVSGTTVLLASGTSQVVVWLTNIVTLIAYQQRGFVDVRMGLILGLTAFLGAQVGVLVAHKVGNIWLRRLLMAVTVVSALKLLL
ncbi:MAG: sulfite exporter TauE/SafE family protein [Candidatus Altiarchaeales archaeon]|nr:sulfite exporter TauE/SafE family protein [Candidatus Altiarchaeales archaeon]